MSQYVCLTFVQSIVCLAPLLLFKGCTFALQKALFIHTISLIVVLHVTSDCKLQTSRMSCLPLKAVHLLGYLREVVQLQLMGHDLGEVMVLLPAALRSFHQTRAQIQRPEEALARHPR